MSTCKSLTRICVNRPPPSLPKIQCRHESTTRRHKKLLSLPEAPSYTPNRSSPTLVFNPPSSQASVYHTPFKFLPKNDRRRALYASQSASQTNTALRTRTSSIASPGTSLSASPFLPPKPSASLPSAVRQPYEKTYHLTDKDIVEIQRLRREDPDTWTRVRLAQKFGCSQFFVGMVAKNVEKAERVEGLHEEARGKWGVRRRLAREDRARRKNLWGQDA